MSEETKGPISLVREENPRPATRRSKAKPEVYKKCGACGCKRKVLGQFCATCGEPFELSNAPTGNPNTGVCKFCHLPILWITTVKGKAMPCNTKRVVITTVEGKTVSGFVAHRATCSHFQ